MEKKIQEYDKKVDKDVLKIAKDFKDFQQDSIEKLNNLVANVLKLNKLENQKIVPEVSTFELSDFLGQTLLAFEHIWEEKNILIDVDFEENLFVKTDKNFLEIVCNNL